MADSVRESAMRAAAAARKMASLGTDVKNEALLRIASALDGSRTRIIEANRADLDRSAKEGLAQPLMKRLVMDDAKIDDVINGIRGMAGLEDPVGKTTYHCELSQGLELYRVTCPIGVIGVIFESRPDALVQISALCLKSSDAVMLKGGSEAGETNRVLAEIIADATSDAGIPAGWICLLHSREDVSELLTLDEYVSLIIPRGSNSFVRMIIENSRIPVLGHADGVCHTYIDRSASAGMAVRIAIDGKVQYPAACNATETILVHAEAAGRVIPALAEELAGSGVAIYGCDRTRSLISCEAASDWHTEYLDKKVSIKIVDTIDEAIGHINTYGSGHTDAIVTEDEACARYFLSLVDSGNVFWNCSTRFSDGFRYGFGAEVGISTSKLHARGPVGLEGMVTYKYKLFGTGQLVGDFAEGRESFSHRILPGSCPFDR
ncbi:MAG: glutamate-5-semialdehyde dehydrogenase [Saccharofermentanales bacterium]